LQVWVGEMVRGMQGENKDRVKATVEGKRRIDADDPGLEIVTPSLSAAQRVQAANDKWFASGTFTHVKKEVSNIPGQNR
jgi:hypothetical protein